MSEYFYTLDLGEEHGEKLQRLAAFGGHDDIEAVAADLLCEAIRKAEAWINSEIYT